MLQTNMLQINLDKTKQVKRMKVVLIGLLGSMISVFTSNTLADEQDPLNFIVGVSRMHDNNLFRLSKNERSDNITSAYAGIRLDKQYAQQRFMFDFTLTANRYQNFNVLDFNAKDYKAAWLWSLTPYLTGTISLDRRQRLNTFQDFQSNNLTNVRNLNVSETQHFEADFSPHNVWHILGGFTRNTQKNTNEDTNTFIGQNSFTSNAIDAGVRYNFRSGSSVTALGHFRKGKFDDGSASILFDNAYDEREAETRLDWIVSGKSRLNARAAYVTREHDNASSLDYSGLEGNVDFIWTVTGKIKLALFASSRLSPFQTGFSTYTRATTFGVRPVYAFSSKINMNAHADVSKRTFLGESSLPQIDREDWSRSAGIGIEWMPMRSLSVGGNLEYSSRNSNIDVFDFTDTTAGVNANLFF